MLASSRVTMHIKHICKILSNICGCSFQDVANDTYDICDTSVLKKKVVITYGQSVHLGCFVKIPEVLKNQQVTWYHHSKEKGR